MRSSNPESAVPTASSASSLQGNPSPSFSPSAYPSPPAGAVLAGGQNLPPGEQRVLSVDLPNVISGANPLVAAANPVLNLVPQIRSLAQNKDPEALRRHLISQIKRFESEAQHLQIPTDTIIGARYCLCTLLDETATQTPWGGMGAWGKHSLLVTFHNETWGGEKFFQLLSKLAQNPQQYRPLLELMYYCLCLGLEGRFRIIDNGKGQLETLRQRLWQILRDNTPERPDTLSPHWPGENTTGPVGWRLLPAWVVASVALLMGVLIYLWFVFALSAPADKVFTQIAAVGLTKTLPPPPPRQGPVRFAKFLEPEVRAGLVTVQDEVDRSIITLRGDGLFASGKATVLERYIPALQRIAEALGAVQGNVMVTGYTDNVPIRTLRYPSNVELSRDRAQNVMEILARSGTPHARLRSQGLGDANPIVANNSPENRSRNRRVEIVLLAAPMMLEEP